MAVYRLADGPPTDALRYGFLHRRVRFAVGLPGEFAVVDIRGSDNPADHAHRRSMVGLVEVGSVEKETRRRELGPEGEVPVSMRWMPPTAP